MSQGEENVYNRMRIFGRVQRVLFRDSAKRRAQGLGLKGYATNLPDGSLEIVAAGEHEKIRELFEWAKRGPIFARVDRFEIDQIKMMDKFDNFKIKY